MTHKEKLLNAKTLEEFIQIETHGNQTIKTQDEFYNYLRYSLSVSNSNTRWYSLYFDFCYSDLYIDISEYEIINKLIELEFDRQVRFRGVYVIHKKDFNYSKLNEKTQKIIENSFASEESDIIYFLEYNNSPYFVVHSIIQTMIMGLGNVSGSCQDSYENIIESIYINQNLSKKSIEIIKKYSKFMSVNTTILSSLLIGEKININEHPVSYSTPIYVKGTYDKIANWFDDRIVTDYYCDFEGFEKMDSKEMFAQLSQNRTFVTSVFEEMIHLYNYDEIEQIRNIIESFIDDNNMVKLIVILDMMPEYNIVYSIIHTVFEETVIDKYKYPNTLALIRLSPKDLI